MKASGSVFRETGVPWDDGDRTFPEKWHQTEAICLRVSWVCISAGIHVINPLLVNTDSILGKGRTNANIIFFSELLLS